MCGDDRSQKKLSKKWGFDSKGLRRLIWSRSAWFQRASRQRLSSGTLRIAKKKSVKNFTLVRCGLHGPHQKAWCRRSFLTSKCYSVESFVKLQKEGSNYYIKLQAEAVMLCNLQLIKQYYLQQMYVSKGCYTKEWHARPLVVNFSKKHISMGRQTGQSN